LAAIQQSNSGRKHPNQTTRRYPVTIVGASAAGLYTAYLLARKGVPVHVIEQAERLAPAARTLIVTHRMRDLLGKIGDEAVLNEVRRFELFTDGRSATVELRQPDLIIERSLLIQSLAGMAQVAGATFGFGKQFQNLRAEPNHLQIEFANIDSCRHEELPAETVIASDGAVSRVAQLAGWPRQPTVPLIQAIVPLPKGMSPDTVRVWFIPQDTPYFYWLIPESATQGALGLIGVEGREAKLHLEQFLEKKNLEPLSFQGARIPVYERWIPVHRQLGAGEVYLVGDAAGQVKVSTVGGIVTGLRGALGVAESILNGGRSSELNSLRRELDYHLLLRKVIHHFQQSDYSHLVDLLNDSARRSLGKHSRDNALTVIWHLCLSQPRMILLGLRSLLAGTRLSRAETY
jgi:digeranylgeranylglycerophospholipid reductase